MQQVLSLSDPDGLRAIGQGELSQALRRYLRSCLVRAFFRFASAWCAGIIVGAVGVGILLLVFPGFGPIGAAILAGLLGVVGLIATIRLGRRWWHLALDLITDDLCSTSGEVIWDDGRWWGQVGARRLWIPFDGTREVPWVSHPGPGRYRVTYLRRSEWVVGLGVPQVERDADASVLDTVQAAVRDELPMDAATCRDLEEGRLPMGARRRVRRLLLTRAAGLVGIGAWLALDWSRLVREPMWLLMVLLGCGMAATLLVLRMRALGDDLREGGVVCAEGDFQLRCRTVGLMGWWKEWGLQHPENGMFLVPRSVFWALLSAPLLKVYYTPRARVVVGVEVLNE